MCAITMILNTAGAPVARGELQAFTDAMAHRGPDGSGLHVRGCVGLGHRRLSIIDLESGAQPMSNEDCSVWVTFNGEIYNYRELRNDLIARGHRFHTASDTEVIVHAYEEYGEGFLSRLRGMFAIVVRDDRRRSLLLARDRLGIKPLYYMSEPDRFVAGSELQAFRTLAGFRPTIDMHAVDLYLHYQYVPAPFTIYREVRKLPPAHYLVVNEDGSHGRPIRYWDVAFRPDRSSGEGEWLERIDSAMRDTVSAHLVSDVPFGAFLSGGVDSSVVLAYMSQLLQVPVQAFTIGHAAADYDERRWAEQAVDACSATHHVEVIEPDALDMLPAMVRHYGEPFADSSSVATWHVSRLARRYVKMVLSGDGGDELFAGYRAYPALLWEHEPRLSGARNVRHLLANGARAAGFWPPRASLGDSKFARTAVLEPELRRRLWLPEWTRLVEGTRAHFDSHFTAQPGEDALGRLQRFDLLNYIPYDNLTKVDTASMSHGLEVRVPLLDHVFVETAAQIPQELKLRPLQGDGERPGRLRAGEPLITKYLLKKCAEQFYPATFVHRDKRGFEIPLQHWFAGPHAPAMAAKIAGFGSPLRDMFDAACLSRIVADAAASRVGAWKAWTLLVLSEWLMQNAAFRSTASARSTDSVIQ